MKFKLKTEVPYPNGRSLLQLAMKTFVFLFCSISFAFVSNSTMAQNAEILINKEKTYSVKEAFKLINQQTDYTFIYRHDLIKHAPKVILQKGSIKAGNLLEKFLMPINFIYEFTDNGTIIVRSKDDTLITEIGILHASDLQLSISGIVLDSQGVPLSGANILEKGTTNGTQADFDGNFSIEVSNESAILVFSYIGFATKEVGLSDGETMLSVTLEESASGLDEVVVVGYGTQVKSSVTGSVASVNSDDIETFPSSSVEQSLAGKLSGVQLSQSSGQPGAGISIRVRGISSISGGNEPLYVIDGIPFFNSDTRGLNGISSINPNDIQSIQVLKDASATAIYGSRGANGVVMVTTKSGTANKTSVVFNSWVSVREIRKKLDLMNGDQFLDFQNRFYTNSGLQVPTEINQIQNFNTDWQDEVFRTGVASNYDLSISGGSEKSQFYISLGYLNEEGIVLNSDFERISVRANLNSRLTDHITLKSSITGSNSVQNGFSAAENNNTFSFISSGIGATLLALPTEPVRDTEGNFTNIFAYDFAEQLENPVGFATNVTDKTTVNRFLGNLTLKAELFKGLYNNTRLGVDYQNRRRDAYFPNSLELVLGGNGAALLGIDEKMNYVVENYFDYKTEVFDEFLLDAVLGASIQKETSKSTFLQSTGFFSDELGNNAIQAGASFSTPLTNNIDQSIASIFGRLNATYKNKYLFGASIRRDGASVFSDLNKTATFPSVSAGWKISEEEFLVDNATVSSLKLRASWGQSGNPGIQPYQSLPLGQIVISSQGAGSGLSTGLAPNLPNRNLTWETTSQTNIGLDAGFLDERITLAVDYYVKDTKDALASVQLPPSGGFSTIIDNVGEVQNKGIEFVLGANIIDKDDLQLDLNFNISKNKNEVTKTKDGQDIVSELSFAQTANADGGISSVVREGEQLGAFLGFNFTGLDDAGIPEYEDVNNDGTIDSGDLTIIGSPIPEILYGLNASLSYKNFAFAMDWQGQSNVKVLNLGSLNLTAPENGYNRAANIYDFYPNPSQSLLHRVSQRYVEDASFLRMRNIRLSYTIPLSDFFIQSLNINLSGQNLITITDYSGFDPDVNSLSGNDVKQGLDLAAYPSSKAYTLGLNIKF